MKFERFFNKKTLLALNSIERNRCTTLIQVLIQTTLFVSCWDGQLNVGPHSLIRSKLLYYPPLRSPRLRRNDSYLSIDDGLRLPVKWLPLEVIIFTSLAFMSWRSSVISTEMSRGLHRMIMSIPTYRISVEFCTQETQIIQTNTTTTSSNTVHEFVRLF